MTRAGAAWAAGAAIAVLACACSNMFGSYANPRDPEAPNYRDPSGKAITSFSIVSPAAVGVINEADKTVSVKVPYGTSANALKSLMAVYATTGAEVRLGDVPQASGTGVNDFTNPVIYAVTADDGSAVNYVVTVTIALNPAKAITSFSFASLGAAGAIDEAAKWISVSVYGTGVTSLVATFAATGASVRVGSVLQASGVTANNYASPVTYIVTAEDGTAANYTVTVTLTAPPSVGASFQGGIVAYIFSSGEPGYVAGQTHGLIAATADLSSGKAWSNITDVASDATGWAIGTGMSNTNAIIAQAGHADSAAKLCRDYRGGGYDDWYLPSANELPALKVNQAAIGGFSPVAYWSSTETWADSANIQDFADGRMPFAKSTTCRVRAVRSF